MKEFDIHGKGLKNTPINFMARSTSDSFQKKFKYTEDAYERKDYETAYKLILPLAEQGYAEAQYNLGIMYSKGQGVQQNFHKKS